MRSEAPDTPAFSARLEDQLRLRARSRRRPNRPFAASALRRLRTLSSSAGHVTVAFVLSTTFLLLSPSTIERDAELPPIAEPPRAGYLSQFGAPPEPNATATITLARESGFEVEVRRTYVADRTDHGEILEMRHLAQTVTTVPVDESARGPLLIVIGFSIGDAGNTAD